MMWNKKKFVVIFLCLSLASLSALEVDQNFSSISSSKAFYDGNTLVLEGSVYLDHELGKMYAETANLEKKESEVDFPFSKIYLAKDVALLLKNGGEINCAIADLNLSSLQGKLFPQKGEKVSYKDFTKSQKTTQDAIQLLSNSAEILLGQKSNKENKKELIFEEIRALEDVIVYYADRFQMHADHATYFKPFGEKSESKIIAYPKNNDEFCLLSRDEDKIFTKLIEVDLNQSELILHEPKGRLLSSFFPGVQKGAIDFFCHQIVWNHSLNRLLLKKDIEIQDSLVGTILCDDELSLIQNADKDRSLIKTISTKGKTTLQYQDKLLGTQHQLISYGSLHMDQEKSQAILESPTQDGQVATNQQVHYEQGDMRVRSDHACIEYNSAEGRVRPSKVILEGNVRLSALKPNEYSRCALADKVSYDEQTQKWILSANPGKKVLFWDEIGGLSISAKEVHVGKDSVGEEEIHGVGNVRFAFTSAESELLKRIFPFYQPPTDYGQNDN